MVYTVTFIINIPQMLAYIPYMDPMGDDTTIDQLLRHLTSAAEGQIMEFTDLNIWCFFLGPQHEVLVKYFFW